MRERGGYAVGVIVIQGDGAAERNVRRVNVRLPERETSAATLLMSDGAGT